MAITLGFDVYGTLIDTHGMIARLETIIGNKATALSNTWRDKQLEYTWRRSLMNKYENFPVCTRDALNYACKFHDVDISDDQKQSLLEGYLTLPTFTDVKQSLKELKASGACMYAFSNGVSAGLETLLTNAGIRDYFLGMVSVDDIKTFKPNPDVYRHFLASAGTTKDQAWLVSSNGFDVIGAVSFGMKAVWVQRSEKIVFDPWGIEPTITVSSLTDIVQLI